MKPVIGSSTIICALYLYTTRKRIAYTRIVYTNIGGVYLYMWRMYIVQCTYCTRYSLHTLFIHCGSDEMRLRGLSEPIVEEKKKGSKKKTDVWYKPKNISNIYNT